MALIQSTAIPSGATDFEIDQSLRFDDGRNTNLERLPVSAGNRKTWTYSCWVKRGNQTGDSQQLLSATNDQIIFRGSSQVIRMMNNALSFNLISTPVYRDNSAWYHIVVAFDTTQSTASNRIKLYVNGEQVTSFSTATYPSQNDNTAINNATTHYIGRYAASGSEYLDGYLSEVNFIDGQALTPADFGETGDYGEWKPIEYSGSYGTNGFYLPFKQDYTVEGFSTVTYKGNGAEQYIGGVGFQSDLTWIKNRTSDDAHTLFDSVRGVTKHLASNTTGTEGTTAESLKAFNTDGFTLGTSNITNAGSSYVAWNWDMGGSNASNTNGSITSTVRANSTYGQSIVSYTGTGVNATVGHGLSSAPEMVIVKERSDDTGNWYVWHTGFAATHGMFLNSDSGIAESNNYWNDTAPTNAVFNLGTNTDINGTTGTDTYIAYCFHSVTGYSKFASYTGTGGTHTITTGFNPAFIMIKRSTSATGEHWYMYDNTRFPYSQQNNVTANNNGVEGGNSSMLINYLATGFQIVGTNAGINTSGDTYIYMAFADKREYAYWLDQSGNNNDWTSNNLTESDVMVDSPTNNFATLNPLYRGMPKAGRTDTPNILGQGNLYIKPDHEKHTSITITPTTGKWYLEVYVNGHSPYGPIVGWLNNQATTNAASGSFYGNAGSWRAYSSSANNTIYLQNQGATSVTTTGYFAAGEILQLAWDCSSGKMWVGRDGDWFDSSMGTTGNPATGANAMFTATAAQAVQNLSPYIASGDEYGGDTEGSRLTLNCGQDSSFAGAKTAQGNQDGNDIGDFFYTPPTGFLALCTKNLPEPTVIPSEHFNTVLYTAAASAGTYQITGVGFQPDFTWVKNRDNSERHLLFDSVRGNTNMTDKFLVADQTSAEGTNGVSSTITVNSDGFQVVDSNVDAGELYFNSRTYVAFNWKANGSGSANTTGTINTISTSANVDAGFSIVKWVGNEGSDESIGHGLSKAPEMILTWNLDEGWGNATYHKDMGTDKYLMMSETTGHENMSDTDIWANTAPTSSVFYIGTDIMTNWDDRNYVGYCFHSVDGYSKFGSFKGNNNADGTFVMLGFRPMWILVKRIYPNGFNWMLFRHDDRQLEANSTSVEFGGDYIDMLSNGFKARTQANTVNDSADYIYMAFAETPFKFANAK